MVTVVALGNRKRGMEKRFLFQHIQCLIFLILYLVYFLPSQKLHLKNTNSERIQPSDHLENAYRHYD